MTGSFSGGPRGQNHGVSRAYHTSALPAAATSLSATLGSVGAPRPLPIPGVPTMFQMSRSTSNFSESSTGPSTVSAFSLLSPEQQSDPMMGLSDSAAAHSASAAAAADFDHHHQSMMIGDLTSITLNSATNDAADRHDELQFGARSPPYPHSDRDLFPHAFDDQEMQPAAPLVPYGPSDSSESDSFRSLLDSPHELNEAAPAGAPAGPRSFEGLLRDWDTAHAFLCK